MKSKLDISLTILIALSIFLVMILPIPQKSVATAGSDKIAHLLAFAALALPFARTRRFSFFAILISASIFGAVIEVVQPFFERGADIRDWVADTCGVALGIALASLSDYLIPRRIEE